MNRKKTIYQKDCGGMYCQNCHSEDILPGEFLEGDGTVIIRPTDQAILSLGLYLKPFVCRTCGFVSTFVDLKDMKRKIEKKQKKKSQNYILIS